MPALVALNIKHQPGKLKFDVSGKRNLLITMLLEYTVKLVNN
jgi:hypothetical protein